MPPTSLNFQFKPIGRVRSCFKEKFGIPRQPGLATTALAELELSGDYADMDAVRGLEQCSHIWVLFLFSEHLDRGWTPLVRPPRSQGAKMGVFATRATFRPNPIGMSAVKLERVESRNGKPVLHLSGIDILDGTPVIDIKPYLPYADSLPDAHYAYAVDGQKQQLAVHFSEQAQQMLSTPPDQGPHEEAEPALPLLSNPLPGDASAEGFRQLVEDVLSCDPRPSHRRKANDARIYGTLLNGFNVRWQINDNGVDVITIEPSEPTTSLTGLP